MSQEKLEILRMVKEQVISVEEAERLLKALDEGEQKRESAKRGKGSLGSTLEGLGEALGGIGSMVQGAVQDAMDGIGVEVSLGGDDDEEQEEVELEEGAFAIPEPASLVIKQRRRAGRSSGGSVKLSSVAGDRCRLTLGEEGEARVTRSEEGYRVVWSGESLEVALPETVTAVTTKVLGGNIQAAELHCPLVAKTMGGNLSLAGLGQPFEGKTMGGNIELSVLPELEGDSRAVTMGGDVKLRVQPGLKARVKAVTMGGQIDVDPAVGKTRSDRSMVRQKAIVTIGLPAGGEDCPTSVSLKTMGGRIQVEKDQGPEKTDKEPGEAKEKE